MSFVMTLPNQDNDNLDNELKELLSGLNATDRDPLFNKLRDLIESKCVQEPKFVVGESGESDTDSVELSAVCEPIPSDIITVNGQKAAFTEQTLEQEDEELVRLMKSGKIKHRELESKVTPLRAVKLRRKYIENESGSDLSNLPFDGCDYHLINGACCENPMGYMMIPVGVAGPLLFNGEKLYLPLATTEGALVASINRGCKVLTESGGVETQLLKDGMTRAPVVTFDNIRESIRLCQWVQQEENFKALKERFDSTSRFAKLKKIRPDSEGKCVYLRFEATTGDAMGMNMISKAVQSAMTLIQEEFPKCKIAALSGNQCVDKKVAAINWIEGRGKTVKAWATIPAEIVKKQLKTTVDAMVELSINKNLIGTSTVVTIGGWNLQAANVVAAMFLATGQDAAQVVSSSMCLTTMERTESGDLLVICDMKSLEVGTVGGGTILAPQQNVLDMLKCKGSNAENPGLNASRLAEIICAAVVAGEVSLAAALLTDDLVKSHMTMNRSKLDLHSASDSAIGKQLGKTAMPSPLSIPTTRVQNRSSELLANVDKIVKKVKHSDCFHLV